MGRWSSPHFGRKKISTVRFVGIRRSRSPQEVEQWNLGRTGLEVSRICLGCMSYGVPDRGNHAWRIGEEDSRPFIKRALEGGVNFFDTANRYSLGSSEEIRLCVGKLC